MHSAEDIVRLFGDMLYRAALSLVWCPEDAEDMVQDCLVKWLTARPEFDSDEHEKAWLLRVVMNLSKNLLASAAHRTRADLLDIYPAEEPEEVWLLEEVAKLPEGERSAVHLFYYEGYKTAEIASILGEKESTVRSWLHRARKKLKKQLEEQE